MIIGLSPLTEFEIPVVFVLHLSGLAVSCVLSVYRQPPSVSQNVHILCLHVSCVRVQFIINTFRVSMECLIELDHFHALKKSAQLLFIFVINCYLKNT